MSTNASIFSFQEETILLTLLEGVIHMRMIPTGPSIARVYFINSTTQNEVPVPPNFTIYDNTNQCKVCKLYLTESFALYWGDNYTITYDNEVILQLVTQRQWSVTTPTKRDMVTHVAK